MNDMRLLHTSELCTAGQTEISGFVEFIQANITPSHIILIDTTSKTQNCRLREVDASSGELFGRNFAAAQRQIACACIRRSRKNCEGIPLDEVVSAAAASKLCQSML